MHRFRGSGPGKGAAARRRSGGRRSGERRRSHGGSAGSSAAAAAAAVSPGLVPDAVLPLCVGRACAFLRGSFSCRFAPAASIGSFVKGASWPMWSLLFGKAISAFGGGADPSAWRRRFSLCRMAQWTILHAASARAGKAGPLFYVHGDRRRRRRMLRARRLSPGEKRGLRGRYYRAQPH
jgi:hypothetical protein